MRTLEIKNVYKSFNKIKVLNGINLEVNAGEIVSITGPSGIGKSTLLRCINGLEKIDRGEILIEGIKIENKISKNVNLQVGLVFQDYNLFPQYSVLKNVTLSLISVLKMNKEKAFIKAKEILKQMNLLEKINSYPYELSGGEKQRVAIARTLAINPKIICFDEPTSALDPKLVKEVSKIINKQYKVTEKIIKENMDLLKLIAETLLEHETITKEQIDYLVKHGKMPEEEKVNDNPNIKEAKLEDLTLEDLQDIAKDQKIKNYEKLSKEELVEKLKQKMNKE